MKRQISNEYKRTVKAKPKRVILIAYEEKTEKEYFKNFDDGKKDYRIVFANDNHTDPINLIEVLKTKMERMEINHLNNDKVYCIFDTDTDIKKDKEIKKAYSLAQKYGIEIITSNPCIELWFYLHFKYTTGYMTSNDILKFLKDAYPQYEKGKNVYDELKSKLPLAINNAKKLEKFHLENGNDVRFLEANPSTMIYKIIEELNK